VLGNKGARFFPEVGYIYNSSSLQKHKQIQKIKNQTFDRIIYSYTFGFLVENIKKENLANAGPQGS
jgi:hypothetical protein